MEIKNFITWFLKKLKCQRGEVADDLDASAIADATYTADIDEDDDTPSGEDDTDSGDQDDPQNDDSDDNPKMAELTTQLTDAQGKIEEQQKEINRLGYALRKNEKPKEPENKETPFTREQLFNLFKEHKDEPEIAFQIFEEMSKQGKLDAQEAAERSIDIKNKKTEMTNFIQGIYPDATKEGTELHTGIQQAIEWAHLNGHPFADQLALGLLTVKNLPEIKKKIMEDAKTEFKKSTGKDLEDKSEVARKERINKNKNTKSSTSDTTKTASLTPSQLETAKKMGFKSKAQLARYAKMLGKKGEMIHSEA